MFVDLTTTSGIQLAKTALDLFTDGDQPDLNVRVGLIFNSKEISILQNAIIASETQITAKRLRFAKALLSMATPETSKQEIIKIAEETGLSTSFTLDETLMTSQDHHSIASELFGFEQGQLAVVTNGRVNDDNFSNVVVGYFCE